MKHWIYGMLALLTVSCGQAERSREASSEDRLSRAEIERRNKVTEDSVAKIVFTDTTFLKTTEPLDFEDLSIVDMRTGLMGNRLYNMKNYSLACDRVCRNLRVESGQLVIAAQSGIELYMSEELYQFIGKLVDMWNKDIRSGYLEIVDFEGGGYHVKVKAPN